MEITFLVGNGFDLRVGMKTKYRGFYEYYAQQNLETDTDCIKNLKEDIKGNIENWADLELALGQYTAKCKSVEEFDECVDDCHVELSKYLEIQASRVEMDENQASIVNVLQDTLLKFYKSLPVVQRNRVQHLFDQNARQDKNYNIINFNYTDVLDRCLKLCGTVLFSGYNGTPTTNIAWPVLHIHGTTAVEMILGVDNDEQIANKEFLKVPKFRNKYLKPLANDCCYNENRPQGDALIKKSDVIVIYGMSMGKTDAYWWEEIGTWMTLSKEHYLFLCNPLETFNNSIVGERQKVEEAKMDTYFSNTMLTSEEKEAVASQIFTIIDPDMFEISLVPESKDDAKAAMLVQEGSTEV